VNCDDVKPQLTAYLDGELEDDRGSAVRGHLRECDACRAASEDEAVLRDGLRALPSLDVPSTLWAGVQRQLANAEVADAHTPHWKLVARRWGGVVQSWLSPRFAIASAAVAVIVCVWAYRYTQKDEPTYAQPTIALPKVAAPPLVADQLSGDDVATQVAALPKQTSDSYAEASVELITLARDARSHWADDRKQVFDAKLGELQHAVDSAPEGRARQKAYRAMIRYLQRVTTRDEVMFAEAGAL
jgi:Putative zinc-finger